MSYTKSEICNMALSNLGLANNVADIDDPQVQTEKVFAQFYNLVLSKVLKRERPQFAIYDDELTATEYPDHTKHFIVPPYMLEVLRINGLTDGWTIEHGEILPLATSMSAENIGALKIKYLRLLTDTGLFTDEFVDLFAWELAGYCCGRLTQDSGMAQLAAAGVQTARAEYQTINLRSAKPRWKNKSKFDAMWRR